MCVYYKRWRWQAAAEAEASRSVTILAKIAKEKFCHFQSLAIIFRHSYQILQHNHHRLLYNRHRLLIPSQRLPSAPSLMMPYHDDSDVVVVVVIYVKNFINKYLASLQSTFTAYETGPNQLISLLWRWNPMIYLANANWRGNRMRFVWL